jgi:hypothetical protein
MRSNNSDEYLSLFSRGNTFPGHRVHLLRAESVAMSLEFFVTYILEWFMDVARCGGPNGFLRISLSTKTRNCLN